MIAAVWTQNEASVESGCEMIGISSERKIMFTGLAVRFAEYCVKIVCDCLEGFS